MQIRYREVRRCVSFRAAGAPHSGIKTAILAWATQWNSDPKPCVWKATAEDTITKVQRGRAALTRQIKSTTDH